MWRNNQGLLENPLFAPVAVCLLIPPALCLIYRTCSVPTAIHWLRSDVREYARPVMFAGLVALLVGVAVGRSLSWEPTPKTPPHHVQTPLRIAPDGTWWADLPGKGVCQIRRSDDHGWQCLPAGARWESMSEPPSYAVVMSSQAEDLRGGNGQTVPSAFLGGGTPGVVPPVTVTR